MRLELMSASAKIKVQWILEDGTMQEFFLPSGQDSALLDLCEDAGVALPFGCRVGACGSCRIQIVEGEELLTERSFLEEDTLVRHEDTQDIRLACRVQIKDQPTDVEATLTFKSAPKVIFKE